VKITVTTGDWAKRYIKPDFVELDLPEHSTVADVLRALPLPPGETGLAAVDGKAVKRNYVLANGNRIKIYPSIVNG
jgi:sulfur carrier protein ThiS